MRDLCRATLCAPRQPKPSNYQQDRGEKLRFLELDFVAEFLYDADEEAQQLAAKLRRMAESRK